MPFHGALVVVPSSGCVGPHDVTQHCKALPVQFRHSLAPGVVALVPQTG